jgi:uncharacterized Zn finger protein (UPF0148 family)
MTVLNINHKISVAITALLFVATGSLQAQDNPHWNKNTCQTCHSQESPAKGSASLVDGQEAEVICESCHGDRGDALPCRHQSDIAVGSAELEEVFLGSIKDGKIVCSTCHDIVYQCERPKAYYGLENPGFLRDRTSRNTSDFCARCHESDSIEKLNPHKGVAASPPSATCTLCHESIPATSADGQLELAFNAGADLNDMCRGCHKTASHPKSSFTRKPSPDWVHLAEPPEKILRKMRETESLTGVSLPLEPDTGKVFCATCHNPHDFKVGSGNGSQAGTSHKLRTNNICQACHEK